MLVVMAAVLFNGLSWAVRFPPLHPNDEAQHYLYASQFDGVSVEAGEGLDEGVVAVPRDLQALAELVDFGPQREVQRTIDLSAGRADQIAALQAEADGPANARVLVADSDTNMLVGHPDFENYHPPVYYAASGQVLRLGHALGLGVRGRLLMGRVFSVLLGLAAVWLAVLLARVVWPGTWGLPAVVGLAAGLQALVAFYTSVWNNDALAFVLMGGFLVVGAKLIDRGPGVARCVGLVVLGVLASATKITMLVLVPMGLAAVWFSKASRGVRGAALGLFVLLGVAVLCWLLIPLGGGEGMASAYVGGGESAGVQRLPPQMFMAERVVSHVKMAGQLWGRRIGNALETDAVVHKNFYYAFMSINVVAWLSGLALLFRQDRQRRRVMLWLLLAPVLLVVLLYVIDYRLATMGGGRFVTRPQYYVPAAGAIMVWTVMGLGGWLRGRAVAVFGGVLLACIAAYNYYVLIRVITPRYFGDAGLAEQYAQVARLWPVPAWSVGLLDVLAVVSSAIAVGWVVRLLVREADTTKGAQA